MSVYSVSQLWRHQTTDLWDPTQRFESADKVSSDDGDNNAFDAHNEDQGAKPGVTAPSPVDS